MEQNTPTKINYTDPQVLETIRATVAAGATDTELAMFLEHCKATGLNPFKREIWFVKTPGYTRRDGTAVEGKVQIMTGIQGYLAIANSHPQYDGMECDVERDARGHPVRAIAKVYRKDRRIPATSEALWTEDSQPTQSSTGKPTIWGKMPTVMLSKVAKSRALREAFPQELNGTYTAEEMPSDYALAAPQPTAPSLPAPVISSLKTADALPPPAAQIYYDLAVVPEAKKAEALEYLDAEGALIDPDSNLYVSPKRLKRLAKYEVPPPVKIDDAVSGDDLPGEWK